MAKTSLDTVKEKISNIEKELEDLKKTKMGTEVWAVQYAQLKADVIAVKRDIDNIHSYGRWLVLLILTIIVTAVINLVVKKQ